MVLRTVRVGDNIDVAQYDDGDHATAMDTDGQPIAIGQSAAGTHAIRQDELPALGNVVSSAANITDHAVVRGDGGARGVQDSLVVVDDAGNVTLPALATFDGRDVSVDGAKLDGIEALADVTDDANVRAALAAATALINVNLQNLVDVGTIGLSGGQITFPAVAVPSADPNTLDDYEEGTWTPTLTGQVGTDPDPTYTAQVGTYVKIGNLVYADFFIHINVAGSNTDTSLIGGFPYTCFASGNSDTGHGVVRAIVATKSNILNIFTHIGQNSAIATLYHLAASATTHAQLTFETYIDDGTALSGSIVYRAT